MWAELAEAWAWDVLDGMPKRVPLSDLYEAWEASRHHLATLRQRLAPPPEDPDVSALVETWATVYASNHKPDTSAHAKKHVRWLMPEGTRKRASTISSAWLEERLAAYPGKQNTRRKVHSSWSEFFGWCEKRGIFPRTPMRDVDRPVLALAPIRFYELEDVQRIVQAQPTQDRRAFLALMYGTGADLSPALLLRRQDVDESTRYVRLAGTKTAHRDRVARIADWAWPFVQDYLRTHLPTALLFPWSRWDASDFHRETVADLSGKKLLPAPYPLRNARHHWAVRAVRAGTPVRVIADQLGNTETIVLRHYARFAPQTEERDYWEQRASEADERRKEAQA
jgi:site-specific recombinase XerD